jgi:cytochrome o ubiquinol oxidase subunit 2
MTQRPAGRAAGPSILMVARALTGIVLAAFALGGCSHGVLAPRGPIASANAVILLDAVAIMTAIVVPTIAAALAFAWWFRAGNRRARYMPDFVYSGRLELLLWAIPLLVIMFLGGVIWIGSHRLDPYQPIESRTKPLAIDVVALDWKWLFIYPDQGIASLNTLTVPAGTPLHFSITSASVMNQFFVPRLGGMIAAMNGMVTQLHLQADQPGDFDGLSAQYSGAGFSGMHFVLHAVAADDFTRFVAATRQGGRTLDRAAYAALARQSRDVQPSTYGAVDQSLFHAIATNEIAPGPGPADTARAGAPAQAER